MKQTVCVVELERAGMPQFFARLQHGLDDFVDKLFGGPGIDFEDDREFSRLVVLRTGGQEAEVRRLFSPSVRALITDLSKKNFEAEGLDGKLIFHYGEHLNITRVGELVDDALRLAHALR
jgi:hypothetical protein